MTNEDAVRWLDNLKNDMGNPHYEGLWPYAQAIDEICYLLKQHDAVRIKVNKFNARGRCGRCPGCGNELNEMDYPNYCGFCGQAVLWNEQTI